MSSNGVYQGSIAIVGGGIIGITLAVALCRRGIDVTIYEQAAKLGEIGAGVAFSSAAIRAMEACAPEIVAAFQKVRTVNANPDKVDVFFDWYNGMSGDAECQFTMKQKGGLGACHRAHYLDEVAKLLPPGITKFGKRLDDIQDVGDGKVTLKFVDGTEAVHHAVVGADGIKSRVRECILGNHPPVYTHKYAYRGLIPIDRAAEALGDDLARNSKVYLGQDGHILTFPIAHGTIMNVVFFYTDPHDWPDSKQLTRPSDRDHIRRDFSNFGPIVHRIIDLLEPTISCWAIFDLPDVPFYNRGRVVIAGDAAHASSPHHGGGAGIGVEDCAILAQLLSDPRIAHGERSIDEAFKAYNEQRLERTHWFVKSSRRCGEVFDWRTELGGDADKIQQELLERFDKVWKGQVKEFSEQAKALL